MKRSESIAKLCEALSKAQGEMKNAPKDKKNPFFKSSYADLASIVTVSREPLSKNGLSIVQPFYTVDNKIFLTTLLMHSSGEWISSEVLVKTVKDDPQSHGSALTYYRRFAWSSILGVATDDDDDGEEATQGSRPKPNIEPIHQDAPQPPQAPAPIRGDFKGVLDRCAAEGILDADIKAHIKSLGVSRPSEFTQKHQLECEMWIEDILIKRPVSQPAPWEKEAQLTSSPP